MPALGKNQSACNGVYELWVMYVTPNPRAFPHHSIISEGGRQGGRGGARVGGGGGGDVFYVKLI